MRVKIGDVKQNLGITETYDIVNAIRNSASDMFRSYVPLANADNITDIGHGIMVNQSIQNEFINSLVDRIGLIVIKRSLLQNPLKKFKKGMMAQGRKIEEIYVDITNEKMYDAEKSEQKVFERDIPNVKTLFHERNRQGFYKQTIQDESLRTAFISWGNFESFLSEIINAMYNSAEVDEFKYMKLLIDNYHSKGLFTVKKVVKPDNEVTTKEFIKTLRSTATKMCLPFGSRDYNSLAVHTRSEMNDLHLIIDADLEANVDVDVLARAFNMDRTNFLGNVTIIDGFASSGLEAVLVDKDWFMVYDNLIKMETIRNPQGLYWNYFLHIWQVLSTSRFANAVAFVSDEVEDVTQVIVSPSILALKQGKTHQFDVFVRQTVEGEFPVEWKVGLRGAGSTKAGTTITQDGLLTVDAEQTGDLVVTASVDISDEQDGSKLVSGECIVSVTPSV